jgi:hypothetical protein
MAKIITKTAKTITKNPIVKKPIPKIKVAEKPIEVIVTPKAPSGWMDKTMDLVKWVDSPFKLFTVIIMGLTGLLGYIAFEQQELIVEKLTSKDKMQTLLADEKLSSLSRDLLRDSGAEIVIVHHINLPQNIRTTRIAQSHDGRFTPLEGKKGSFFSDAPERNKAAISMLNGEILCEPFKATSSAGDWIVSRGVTYTCRGSIPPDVGHMIGYITVGFKKEPRDISSVKSLINQTARAMTQ